MDEELRRLINSAWDLSQEFPEGARVPNSFPILYFGDLERYRSSKKKIVTVGLNPSKAEFPANRFPEIIGVTTPRRPTEAASYEMYLTALDQYFEKSPYTAWFDSYEYLLRGFDTSYWNTGRNVALNTDICFPVATFGKVNDFLRRSGANALAERGSELWRKLISYLNPGLVLFSGSQRHRNKLGDLKWRKKSFLLKDREKPYDVAISDLPLDGKGCPVVSGPYFNRPFAGLKYRTEKVELGKRIEGFLQQEGYRI